MAEKNLNVLGMDKFMTAAIKRSYANVKPIIKKRDKALLKVDEITLKTQQKIEEKIKELKDKMEEQICEVNKEVELYNNQIEALDAFALINSERTCGYRLSSEKCIEFIENPEKFEEFKKQVNPLFEMQLEMPQTEEEAKEFKPEETTDNNETLPFE